MTKIIILNKVEKYNIHRINKSFKHKKMEVLEFRRKKDCFWFWKKRLSYFLLYFSVFIQKVKTAFRKEMWCNSRENILGTVTRVTPSPRSMWICCSVCKFKTGYLELCNYKTGLNTYIKIKFQPSMYMHLYGC